MDYEPQSESSFSVSSVLGVVLMFVGVVFAVFIGQEILSLYRHPESHRFTVYLTEKLAGAEVASATTPSGGSLKIGGGGALLIALAAFAFLAGVAARIAASMIRAGFNLTFGAGREARGDAGPPTRR